MKRYINIIILLMVGTMGVMAQGSTDLRSADKSFFNYKGAKFVRQRPTSQRDSPRVRTTSQVDIPPVRPDVADTMSVALYASYVKQHGWVRGIGEPLTAEQASHLNLYYRLSRKNKAGHWTRKESLDGYGRPSSHGATYLINPYDENDKQIDEQWREKLKKIVTWEFVSDNTGENCVQENAYDAEGNLILSYSWVRVGPGKYMGHYVDAWGLPLAMRDKQGAKYVLVQRDANGYEADVSFIGDDGFYKKNSWGAFRAKYIYDKKGNQIQHMSANVDGDYMLDRAGNSGMKQTFDKDGWITSATNLNDRGEVIRVALSETADEDFIRRNYYYDQWGRDTLETFVLADGVTPDTTSYGLHSIRRTYNEHGQVTLFECCGIDGRPASTRNGASVARRRYDDIGNEIYYECRDAKGRYFNNPVCLGIYRYDGESMTECREYKTTSGLDTVCTYHFRQDGRHRIYEYPETDTREEYIYDGDNHLIADIYTTLDGKPKVGKEGYHRQMTTYQNRLGSTTMERRYLDTADNPVSLDNAIFRSFINSNPPYNSYVVITDSLNRTQTIKEYDGNKLILQYETLLTNDFSRRLGETSLDLMGQRARAHYSNGLYYDCYTGNTIKGGWSIGYVSIANEYGEVGYRMSDDGEHPDVYAFKPRGESKYLDEYGEVIRGMSKFRNKLPLAFMIEVYDSTKAPRWDIRSGDVIMRYGDWHHPKLTTSNGHTLREATFAHANEQKTMVVMRRNPVTNEAEPKVIALGPGLPADFGFYFHDIYATRQEQHRYGRVYRDYEKSPVEETLTPKTIKGKEKESSDTLLFLRPYRSLGEMKNLYGRGVVDDAIVLGLVVQDAEGTIYQSRYQNGIGKFNSNRQKKGREVQRLWFTTDLRTVHSLELKGGKTEWDADFWYDYKADQRICQPVKSLLKEANSQMDAYIQQLSKHLGDSLYNRYGDAAKAVKNDSVTIMLGRVEGDEGYMVEKGYSGMYVILEWCGWKCTDGYDRFMEVFEQNRKNNKQMLLLPVDSRGDVDFFGDVMSVTSDKPLVGLYIFPHTIGFDYFKKEILEQYQDYKK